MPLVRRFFPSAEELVVFVNGRYRISGADAAADTIVVGGRDLTPFLSPTDTFDIVGSTGNDGTWTVQTISCNGSDTTIKVTGDLLDDTPDGSVQLDALAPADLQKIVGRDDQFELMFWQ